VKLINGFMIVKRPADPLMKFAIDSAVANIRDRKSLSVWDVTGPGIFRRAYASELRPGLFEGFEILDMHSAPVSRVFVFHRRDNKVGPKDWRRMRDANETIYLERLVQPEAGDDQVAAPPVKRTAVNDEKRGQQDPDLVRKIAFLHIPKSGGVSIEQVLKRHFPDKEIAPYYFPSEYAKVGEAADFASHKLIIGHFDYDLLARLDRTFIRAVLFREPLQLVVSLYNHAASRPAHRLHTAITSGELSFEKFSSGVGGSINILSKYLLGRTTYFALTANGVNEKMIARGAETATTHLAEFDCIGMLDDVQRFGQALSSVTGIDASNVPQLNGSQPKHINIGELTPTELASLERANRLDLAVYEAVRKCYEAGDWRSGNDSLP
jgi:hypothetical protein